MKFIFINGGGDATTGNRVLRFDNSDDLVTIFDSIYYDYGVGDFCIGLKVLFVKQNPTSSVVDLLGKRKADLDGYVINTRSSHPRFVINKVTAGQGAFVLYGSTTTVNAGEWVSIIAQRNGGGSPGNLNRSNYHLFYNGVEIVTNSDTYSGSALSDSSADFDSDFKIGNQSTAKLYLYLDSAFTLNRALTQDEITNYHANNIVPVDGATGIWLFNSQYGSVALDESSVNENGTLTGYTNTELGIPDPLTARAWVRKDGVIWYGPSLTNNVKQFTAPFDCIVYRIGRFYGMGAAAYSLDNSSFTTIPYTGASDSMVVDIELTSGQILYLRGTTTVDGGTLEVYYEPSINGEPPVEEVEDVDVILIWGQSNARGVLNNSASLPIELKSIPLALIYGNTSNSFSILNTATNKADSGSYGPEMKFAYEYAQLVNKSFYIVKHAITGAPLASEGGRQDWFPANNEMYLSFKNYVNGALNLLRSMGKNPIIKFALGVQGERDAGTEAAANAYGTNMNNLYNLWKSDFAMPSMKFVHIRLNTNLNLTDYPYRDTVRGFHESVAAADPTNIKWADSDSFALMVDGVHYAEPNDLGLALFNKTQEF